jgi:polar amino acid transport system substrate-binding protein
MWTRRWRHLRVKANEARMHAPMKAAINLSFPSQLARMRSPMNMLSRCAAVAAIAGAIICGNACAAIAKEWREVRIASEGARPPYNYLDPNGVLMGFEIDLGNELCRRMNVVCTFVSQDWDSLIPGLVGDKFDAIMAAMEITEERLQTIDFTKPYVRMPNTFVVGNDSALRNVAPKTLKDLSIGVEADSAHQSYLENVYPGSTVKGYANIEEAILDLAEGRVDAVLGDKEDVMDFMKNRREAQCCKVLDDVPRDPTFFSEGIGIGIRQADQDLKTLFNKALDEAIADGTYSKIRTKYFDFTIR